MTYFAAPFVAVAIQVDAWFSFLDESHLTLFTLKMRGKEQADAIDEAAELMLQWLGLNCNPT